MNVNRCLLICLILSITQVAGQSCENLVFEGAGVRGIAYAGAIRYLEESGKLNEVIRVGGTSAGAITALALSLGYSSVEIESIIRELKLQQFNDGRFFFVGGVIRLGKYYGWYRGESFSRWLEELIEKKTGNADITFQQLHEAGFRTLAVTGTSLNHQKTLIFSHETFPAMRVKDAVRISMSIPIYFQPVIIDSVGNIVTRRKAREEHHFMIDGGLTANFPIRLFATQPGTVGFRIDTQTQIENDRAGLGLAPVVIKNFNDYLTAFYTYGIESLNRSSLTAEDWKQTISISSGSVGPKIRRLSLDAKNELIANGYTATKLYFEQ